jgi:hypothetical protein
MKSYLPYVSIGLLEFALGVTAAAAKPVPAAPSNLTATPVSSSQINLTWRNNSSNETGFYIQRTTNWFASYTEASVGARLTNYSDTSLAPATTYSYRVRARNSAGYSAYSNTNSATTFSALLPPAAPSNLSGMALSSSQINLTWRDNSTNEVQFFLDRSTNGFANVIQITLASNVTSYVDTNLSSATTYSYRVRAWNSGGYSGYANTNSTGTLAIPPAITQQPQSQTVLQGGNAGFSVTATGDAPISYQWRLNGNSLANATNTSLSIGSVQTSNAGNYDVVVSNLAGSGTSVVAVLTVRVPPQITQQPQSQSVLQGSSAGFSVTATGDAPLSYQWRLNGNGLANATNTSFSIGNVQASNAGNYDVVVSNLAGSVTSVVAVLTVVMPPNPPTGLAAQPIASTQITLTWVDNSTNELQFKIEQSTNAFANVIEVVLGPGATNYVVTNVLPGINYSFRVRACNTAGCSDYSNIAETSTGTFSGWAPIFQGIDHATGLTAIGVSPTQAVQCLRIDLQNPGIRLTSDPRNPNYVPESSETVGMTTSHFLLTNGLQAAMNGQWFTPCCTGTDGTAEELWGLAMSSNIVVSSQENSTYSAAMLITSNNAAIMVGTNWPATNTTTIWTALSGKNALLYRGMYVGTNDSVAPRSALGLSQDKRYLILQVIDGRQPDYSDGGSDLDTAAWLSCGGAWDALMLDGGGSSTLVISDGNGGAALLNRPVNNNVPGQERAVGNHLGVYAQPLPGPALVSLGQSKVQKPNAPVPLVAAVSRFDITPSLMITSLGVGRNRLTVRGAPDYTYRLQWTDHLDNPTWQTLATGKVEESGLLDYLDTGVTATRFYRAVNP